jgi:signal transduction histidine kinase
LVGAIKEYTHMDQAPVQNVDVVKSLETTLTILNHKLKQGVVVKRDYQPIPLLVNSFGSELNQVWTNIIDNAIDAMRGKGELRIRTYRDDACVVVEVADNGPGIPDEVQPHIFEPFFTTKAVGERHGPWPGYSAANCEEAQGKYSGQFQTWGDAFPNLAAVVWGSDLREAAD